MSTVVMHNVVSVDGYIADDNDAVGPLFEWYFNGDHPLTPGEMDEPSPGGLRVSKASYDYIRPTWDAIGSMVIGRHLFDMTNGWEGRPPAGEHVVVVSHRPKPAPLCQAALHEGSRRSAMRLLKTASEMRLLRHRNASLRDLPSEIFLR